MAQVGRRAYRRAREAPWAASWDGGGARPGGTGPAGTLGEVPRGVLVAIAVLAAVAVALGAVLCGRVTGGAVVVSGGVDPEEDAVSADAGTGEDAGEPEEAAPELRVHVVGAVASPGVYGLAEGARVLDAVEAAGGFAAEADPAAINLAEPLSDGCKVTVPAVGEDDAGEEPAAVVEPAGASASGAGTVNINTATAEELQALPGVGEATAAAIVEDRERNGPFSSPEDIMRVSGIGEKKFERMRDMVAV